MGEKNGGNLNEPSAKILWSPQLPSLRLRQGQLVLWDDNGPSPTSLHVHIMKAFQKAVGHDIHMTATFANSLHGTTSQTLLVKFQKVYINQVLKFEYASEAAGDPDKTQIAEFHIKSY